MTKRINSSCEYTTTSVHNLQITENGGAREGDRIPKQEGDLDQHGYVLNYP